MKKIAYSVLIPLFISLIFYVGYTNQSIASSKLTFSFHPMYELDEMNLLELTTTSDTFKIIKVETYESDPFAINNIWISSNSSSEVYLLRFSNNDMFNTLLKSFTSNNKTQLLNSEFSATGTISIWPSVSSEARVIFKLTDFH